MSSLENIKSQLAGNFFVRSVERLPKGHIRIATRDVYPDGAHIDVFVRKDPLQPEGPMVLSDLGNTTAWLLDVGIKPWLSKKRRTMVEDSISPFSVVQRGGELQLHLEPSEDLAVGIFRLSQACVRVAALNLTRRDGLITPLGEDIEAVFEEAGLSYEPNVELATAMGGVVRLDYVVSGRTESSAVQTLASSTATGAHVLANEVFRKWFDLSSTTGFAMKPVTVFEDRRERLFRPEDLTRLERLSFVVGVSERNSLVDYLAA